MLTGVKLRHYDRDGTVSHGTADSVTYVRDSGSLSAKALTATLPPGPRVRRGGIELVAGEAEGDLNARDARAHGGVRARTGAGDDIRTEEARLDAARNLVSADVPVEVQGPGYALAARGYRLHLTEERLELVDGVTASSSGAKR